MVKVSNQVDHHEYSSQLAERVLIYHQLIKNYILFSTRGFSRGCFIAVNHATCIEFR